MPYNQPKRVGRRIVLGASLALPVASLPAFAAQRSQAATYGAAPFETEHLIPEDTLDLAQVDLSSPLARVIALTIDDGPHPNDRRILEILRRHDAQATFFYIGRKLPGQMDVAREVAASGNEIGHHTHNHPMMTDIPRRQQERNFTEAKAGLARIGVHPTWFRPPYGDFDQTVARQAQAHGMQAVLWTVDSRDWKDSPASVIADRVTERLVPGAIILMHSTKPASVQALPAILEEGQRQGFRFVTMTEWRECMSAAAPATPSTAG